MPSPKKIDNRYQKSKALVDKGICCTFGCGKPVWRVGAWRCIRHQIMQREAGRKLRHSQIRSLNGTYLHSMETMKPYWKDMSIAEVEV